MTSEDTTRRPSPRDSEEVMTQLQISGMTCDACATHVEQALEKVPGVRSARVSYAAGTARLAMASDRSEERREGRVYSSV